MLAVGGRNSKRCLATPEAMRSAALWAKTPVMSAGARVAAPAFLTMGMNCPATRPPSRGGAERECAPAR